MMRSGCVLLSVAALLAAGTAARAALIVSGYDPSLHDRFYGPGENYVGDPVNWSGVALANSETWVTMVSPTNFLSAYHYHPVSNQTVTFHLDNNPAGPTETRTVTGGKRIGTTDLWVGTLASPVSSNVSIFPLPATMPATNQSLVVFGKSTNTTYHLNQRTGFNTLDYYTIAETGLSTGMVMVYDYDAGLTHDTWVRAGDSGGPAFAYLDGAWSVAGIHWLSDTNPVLSADTSIYHYRDLVLAEIPEPAALSLLALAAVVVRRRAVGPAR